MEKAGFTEFLKNTKDEVQILDDPVDILEYPVDTSENIGIGALDHVIDVFGELGDTLDILRTDVTENVEVNSIDSVLNEFDQIERHLNQFKIDENLLLKPFKEPIDAITSLDAFQSLSETASDNLEIVDEKDIPAHIESMTEIVSETFTDISAVEMKNDSQEGEETKSPFAQMVRFLGSLWESLIGEDQESIHPRAFSLNDTEVYFLFFLVFTILFMLILGLLLCFYCKKKMWERERWTEIMQSSSVMDSDCSGSWISIDSSTQVSPIMYTPTKDKDGDEFDELFWLRRKLEISPSILV